MTIALAAALVLAGCGGDDAGGSDRSPEEATRAYLDAKRAGDEKRVCELYSDEYKELIANDPDNPDGRSCEETEASAGPDDYDYEIQTVETSGDHGIATVTCDDPTAFDCSLPLAREDGEWRIDGSLSPND